MIKIKECKYCDGTVSGNYHGEDEPKTCLACGAEWDPVEAEYPDDYFDFLDDDE